MAAVSKKTIGEHVFDTLNHLILAIFTLCTLYPVVYVLFSSLSDPSIAASTQKILLWPTGFSLEAYKLVVTNPKIVTGYTNTILIVGLGTTINVLLTTSLAYGLSRKWLYGRKTIMFIVTFSMMFGPGLIPMYLLVKNLGLYNNYLALILPNAVATWNLIITRTYFLGIPESLEESAKIDGAKEHTILFKIMMPLAMPIIAVNVLFYSVGHWNSWFSASIYLRSRSMYPLSLILREILIQEQMGDMSTQSANSVSIAENLKYAMIMISIIPILCAYPFLQRYFVHGVMVGSIKG